MTLKDLHDYYLDMKNTCNEIVLFNKADDTEHTFRRYKEIFTGENKWLKIDSGYLYSDIELLSQYTNKKRNILDILKSMEMLTDIKVKNDIDGISVHTIRKIDDDAFVRVEDGKVMSSGCRFVYNINEFRNYEVVQ